MIVNRLRPILSNYISQHQSAFLPGRGSSNNAIIFQEVIDKLNLSSFPGQNLLLKSTSKRLMTTLDGPLLKAVLPSCSSRLLVSASLCIVSPHELFNVGNGRFYLESLLSGGLRQGDHICSPRVVLSLSHLFQLN